MRTASVYKGDGARSANTSPCVYVCIALFQNKEVLDSGSKENASSDIVKIRLKTCFVSLFACSSQERLTIRAMHLPSNNCKILQ